MAFYKQKGDAGGGGGSKTPLIINVPADFPTTDEVNADIGRHYYAGQDVTDNDASKTNTGQSFKQGQDFLWDGVAAYFIVGDDPLLNQFEKFTATAGKTVFTILGPTPIDPGKSKLAGNGVTYEYDVDYTISGNTLTWTNASYTFKDGNKLLLWYNSSTASIGALGFTARVVTPIPNVTGDNTTYIVVYDTVDRDTGAPGLPTLYDIPPNGTAIVPADSYMVSTTLHLSGISDSHAEMTVQAFSATQTPFLAKFDPRPERFNISGGQGELVKTFSMPLYMPIQTSHSIRLKLSDVGGTPAGKTVSVEASSYYSMYKY